ncbi:chaperonin 10-like protein [Fennellomyces sp. T-0311]|nr:chaperonin 10-like protein [Fennellomyces sp. T-0311]
MLSSSESNNNFYAWASVKKDEPLERTLLSLKQFEDDDVEIAVTHCGICGSDIHTVDCDWGAPDYPCVVGHEIAGVITAVGKNVTEFKVGERVGVGPQCSSCRNCKECKNGQANLCRNSFTTTFNSHWPSGEKTYGGFADKWRGNKDFVFKIPENMSNEQAATLFCAGITTYVAFRRYGITQGSKIGIIGLGGLGHLSVQWAKAMGAKVVVFSSSDSKREDAMLLGADEYVVSSDENAFSNRANTLTHILCTTYYKGFNWDNYLAALEPTGTFIVNSIPGIPFDGINPGLFVFKQLSIAGSFIGSPKEMREMLEFAGKAGIKPWIEKYPMSNINSAMQAYQ